MSTISDIITDELKREGGATVTNDTTDKGGATQYGISKAANPKAWADGKVTEEEARAIYEAKYVDGPGFRAITDPQLQRQLIDFSVLSGPAVAIQKLQEILKVEADGVLGPETLAALKTIHADDVNNSLVAKRVMMIGRIVAKNPSQVKFLVGWLDRVLSFLI